MTYIKSIRTWWEDVKHEGKVRHGENRDWKTKGEINTTEKSEHFCSDAAKTYVCYPNFVKVQCIELKLAKTFFFLLQCVFTRPSPMSEALTI